MEKDHPEIPLTDKLQIVFFELPKFIKLLKKIDDNLGLWLYTIKNSPQLEEASMKMITAKNPIMEKTFSKLKRYSLDPELVSQAEMREKALKDYNTDMSVSYEEGIEKGMEKGLEQGVDKEKVDTSKRMLTKGESVAKVAEFTELPIKQIEKIKAEHE